MKQWYLFYTTEASKLQRSIAEIVFQAGFEVHPVKLQRPVAELQEGILQTVKGKASMKSIRKYFFATLSALSGKLFVPLHLLTIVVMSFLTRKYPFKQSEHWLRDSIVYGVIIWAILYILQPFGFSMYQGNKCLLAALFGLITSCCYALYAWAVSNPLLKCVKPWRIWHEACLVFGLILFIAVSNYLFLSLFFNYHITFRLFLLFFYWTVIIGVIITVMSIGIAYNRSLRDRLETMLSNTTEEQKDISITIHDTNVRGTDLMIPINNLLYLEAQKNNVSVCYLKDGKPTNLEVHTTLTAVIEELKAYENIFQCHRSFVVNVNNITSAKGNSNGYQLTLGSCTAIIPVSRSYVPRLKSFIA